MKAISTILAIILIVLIVIGIVGLSYSFFYGLVTGVMGPAVTSVNQTTVITGSQFRIVSATNVSETELKVYIRNIGTQDIDMSQMVVFLDDDRLTDCSC